jgi:hypothetical protein
MQQAKKTATIVGSVLNAAQYEVQNLTPKAWFRHG